MDKSSGAVIVENARRNTGHRRSRGDVLRHDSACPDSRITPNPDILDQAHIRPYIYIVPDYRGGIVIRPDTDKMGQVHIVPDYAPPIDDDAHFVTQV